MASKKIRRIPGRDFVSNFNLKQERKQFDLYDENVKKRMDRICNIIDNSIKKGMSFEEVAARLLDRNMREHDFLLTYISEYNARTKEAMSKAVYTVADMRNFRVLGGNNTEVLKEIYKRYKKNKERKQIKESIDNEDEREN